MSQVPASETVQQAYGRRVAAGAIVDDAAQQTLLPLLEDMRLSLLAAQNRRRISGLFSKSAAPSKGLYLWGGVGRGKSLLMDLFVATVTVPKQRVHFHGFMQDVHGALHRARRTGVDDALKPVARAISQEVRLLALDEMQINDITDAMIVGRLFELLLNDGVMLVTTSNRAPDGLYPDGLNRDLFLPFIALLHDRLAVRELASATDYRQGMLVGRAVYFSPANADARAAIDAIWHELAAGEGEELVLNVKGRETVLRQYQNGVVRATFWELCGKPLGPGDYLALAALVRVLILEDVPRLGRSNYNEAKRFVILIDTLYEAQVRLVMSAADVPERLYLEGVGSFEFERTASRLHEMQSDGWGGGRQ